MNGLFSIQRQEFETVTKLITELFEDESPKTWFSASSKSRGGKLWSTYKAIRDKYIKIVGPEKPTDLLDDFLNLGKLLIILQKIIMKNSGLLEKFVLKRQIQAGGKLCSHWLKEGKLFVKQKIN